MAKSLGTIGLSPAGDWAQAKEYKFLATVSHNGNSYASRVDKNVGHEPPAGQSDAYWQLMAKHGNHSTEGVAIIDDLTSDDASSALSANQGRVLAAQIANMVSLDQATADDVANVTVEF